MAILDLNRVAAGILIFTLSFSILGHGPSYFGDAAAAEDEMHDEHQERSKHKEHEEVGQHDADNMSSYVNEKSLVRIQEPIGENSMVIFKAEKQSAQIIVHVEHRDLSDGNHNVTIVCGSPESSLTFAEKLEVAGGHGEFEGRMTLRPATYSDCTISAGTLSVMIPSFTIVANVQHGHSHGTEHETESKVRVKHDGIVRFEGMMMHPGFEAGMYNVTLNCKVPEGLSIVFNNAFVMDRDGEGKLLIETSFGSGNYSGCAASVVESGDLTVIATFDSFSIVEEHEVDGRTLDEKRSEKRHAVLERIEAGKIPNRHTAEKASSTGYYEPGMEYRLTANGTVEAHNEVSLAAEADLNISVWKSNRVIILMDVTNGTVTLGENNYTVRLGYAVYSLQHGVLSLRALGTNDSTGEIVSLKMRGHATSDDAAFPVDHEDTLEIHFDGNNRRLSNQIGSWELFLNGTIGT